jgi:hypothetical protein
MAEQITYEGFLNLIESMVERKESGTVYIRTNTNHSVFVGLNKGHIEAFTSGPKHGLEAITTILQMSHGSCRRNDTVLTFHACDLPSTSDILLLLQNRSLQPMGQESPGPSPAPGAQIDSRSATKILCDLLHDYVGPVAPIICEDVIDNGAKIRTSADLESAIGSLAEEIDSSAEAAEFINRARENLREIIS